MLAKLAYSCCGLLVVVAISNSTARAQEAADWKKFESKEFKFSVEFPQSEVFEDETENAKHFFTSLPDTDTDFRIGVSNVAAVPQDRKEAIETMNMIRDSVAESFEAKVENPKEIEAKGNAGIEFTLLVDFDGDELAMTCRYFIIEDRLYQVMVVRMNSMDLTKETKRFFDSFEIAK
ncbi:MAG TPA: hypothetical protein PKD54_05130 [Pirellulaceae bacterium]|nr:hypothetical protein [Pirellulaceae bacterium]